VLKDILMETESTMGRGTPEWDERYSFVPRLRSEAPSRSSPSPPQVIVPPHGRSISVDDVPFSLVPPRMPAAAQESHQRQLSFPSTTRGSDMSALFDQASPTLRLARPADGKRIDVTSFIGGLSRPIVSPAAAATHVRQESDKSKRTIRSSVIAEEGEMTSSAPPSSAEVAAVLDVNRYSGSARARLIDAVREMGAESPLGLPYDESPLKSSMTITEPRPVARRQVNALPVNPRPAGNRSASSSPVQRLKGAAIQISSPVLQTAEESKSFERPRPPPLVLAGQRK